MAKIGYGYGSEWQLMRFLARHRNQLEKKILKELGESAGDFKWLDFRYDKSNFVGDQELKGLSFLDVDEIKNKIGRQAIEKIKKNYISNWNQSWDAIFVLNDTIYLVEAKAHDGEIKGNKDNGGKSKMKIKSFMSEQLANYNISVTDEWMKEYYQLTNRLATAAYLSNNGVKAKCLYIYFLNGYNKPNDNKSVQKEDDFKKAIDQEMIALGLDSDSEALKQLYAGIFIDCLGNGQQ